MRQARFPFFFLLCGLWLTACGPAETDLALGAEDTLGTAQAAVCGDWSCDGDENTWNCQEDCGSGTCGDGICDPGEGGLQCYNCPGDCGECPY